VEGVRTAAVSLHCPSSREGWRLTGQEREVGISHGVRRQDLASDGIEPPTPGFSVPETRETIGHHPEGFQALVCAWAGSHLTQRLFGTILRAHRATHVASDVMRRIVPGSAGMGSGRRLGGGVSRRHGRCDLTRAHRSHKPQSSRSTAVKVSGSVNELTDGTGIPV